MTETICVLGAAARLVGCTDWCKEPADALGGVTRLGGTKNPRLERAVSLAPDLVVVNGEENRAEDIAWLRARCPVLEHMPRNVIDAAAALRDLGVRLEALELAEPLLLQIEAGIARAEVEALAREPVRVFYAIWKKPWMSINADTYIHDVLQRAGAINVCAGFDNRYPVVEPAVVAADVEVVLLSSEPWDFGAADRDEILAAKLFGERARVVLCDGRDFCWHGARTAAGLGRAVDLLLPFRRRRRA
jgi:ABC-type Fe3+-hydroxamate transport system substrate-binding protein